MSAKRIAIVGGGPIGLEAALYARTLGHETILFERGAIADNVHAWGFVQLFSPWRMNTTPLGRAALPTSSQWTGPLADVCPSGEELRQRYLLPIAQSDALRGCVHPHTRVVSISREDLLKSDAIGKPARGESPFRVLVEDDGGGERIVRADVVLDCSGTYSRHRWAGRGGIPAPGERTLHERIWYTLPDVLGRHRNRFADRHTLLIGCGHSAATVLLNLQKLQRDHPATHVSWAVRRAGQALRLIHDDPLPARHQLATASLHLLETKPPWLQYLGDCGLDQISADDRFAVTLKFMNTDLALTVDEVIALVGYSPDDSIFQQLQVHQCYATAGPMKLAAALLGEASSDCLTAGTSLAPDTLKNPEPNFFILGAKSYGTNSNFLLQLGHRQIRDAFRLIHQDATLDLSPAP